MRFAALLCAGMLCACAGSLQAETLTFDDLTTTGPPVPNGYHGLNFNNFYVETLQFDSTRGYNGYTNGTVSPSSVIYNGFANPASFSAVSGTLTLDSFYLTAAINNGLTVTVTGALNGVVEETAVFEVSTMGPTLETLDWANIDTVNFVSSGGVQDPRTVGNFKSGAQFALDSLTINQPASTGVTPEPSSLALFGTGVLGLVGAARRRLA